MPTDWQYHADGVSTGVKTTHGLDGSLNAVYLQLDCFKVRQWTELEVEESKTVKKQNLHWDEREELYEQYADGSHATLKYSVNGGVASLDWIRPEDGDEVKIRHFALIPAAERVLHQMQLVGTVEEADDAILGQTARAEEVFIDALDA